MPAILKDKRPFQGALSRMFSTLGDIFPLCCLPVIECNICRILSMTPNSPGSPQSPDLYHRMNARRFTEHFSVASIDHFIFFHTEVNLKLVERAPYFH